MPTWHPSEKALLRMRNQCRYSHLKNTKYIYCILRIIHTVRALLSAVVAWLILPICFILSMVTSLTITSRIKPRQNKVLQNCAIFISYGIYVSGSQWGVPWWRHQMETFSALLAICAVISPVSGEFPAQWPVTRSFGVFFDLRLNERLSKQSWGWWFETPSSPFWRHSNAIFVSDKWTSDRSILAIASEYKIASKCHIL